MEYFNAFLCGGILCLIGQLLIDKTPLPPAKILVLYEVTGVVLGGAGVFSYFMTMSKIPMILAGVIASMNMPPMAVMFAIIVCMSLLGCFIPAIPLMLICVPIFLPLAALFGWNLIWFGVIINILVTMAGMTPPFGVSLFVAKELADVPLSLVYRSSIPFVLAFFLCLGFCIAFEPLSTWLPAMMR